MKPLILLTGFLCAMSLAQIAFSADDLELNCRGSGVASDVENTTANSRDSDKKRSSTVVQSQVKRPFEGAIEVKIGLGSAKVRIPPGMYPAIHIGNKNNWIDISDVVMNEREITGTFKINILNKPKLRIDRVTGDITVASGMVEFAGACAKVDADAKPKF